MPQRCVFPNCKSSKDACEEDVLFFTVPRNPIRFKLWEEAIACPNFKLKQKQVVCSKHFDVRDIIQKRQIRDKFNKDNIIGETHYKKPKLREGSLPLYKSNRSPRPVNNEERQESISNQSSREFFEEHDYCEKEHVLRSKSSDDTKSTECYSTPTRTEAEEHVFENGNEAEAYLSEDNYLNAEFEEKRRNESTESIRVDDQSNGHKTEEAKIIFSFDDVIAATDLNLPLSWSKCAVTKEIPCVVLSEVISRKIGTEIKVTPSKQIIIGTDLNINLAIMGKRIDPVSVECQAKVRSIEELKSVLKRVIVLKVCSGVSSTAKFDSSFSYQDAISMYRHVQCCFVVEKGKRCCFCEKLKRAIKQKTYRLQTRANDEAKTSSKKGKALSNKYNVVNAASLRKT